ncbi:hypothetical protein [methane-oxidizing endosymbiont of Gigantopelta aegis]|uniref:hypothetical protein n=1 Tax=methane-oxidizing endosymbiont of Gigantopelta aegis TaxID=2794938 RepID=UPI0018DDE213|nr:hypothetical protein [methane-oxidizing endosymbiont of Gigantopelta aegis]
MPVDIVLTVIATSFIQALFGVGVLLFGTPTLLLLGYSFVDTLSVLLPISIAINALQIVKHYAHIDLEFVKQVLRYTIPPVVLFLVLATKAGIDIAPIVGIFLILVALKSFFPLRGTAIFQIVAFPDHYLIVMGIVHGLTNLGGAMLTAIVHGKSYDKNTTRVTIAVCYALFALFQLVTLLLSGQQFHLAWSENVTILQIGIIVFLLTEEFVYSGIDNNKYSRLFAAFLLASGSLLIIKSL